MLIFIFCHYKSVAQQPEFLSDWDKKQYYSFPLPTDAICEILQESASWLQRYCLKMLTTTDGQTTTDGRMTHAWLYYKLTYKPSAQVS